MKKIASILAVALFALGMVSCENNNAANDDFYDTLEVTANDNNGKGSTGGSGGQ